MEFYDRMADSYGDLFSLEKEKVRFIHGFVSASGQRVLDVGCGSADLGLALAAEGARYLGIDLNRRMIEVAQKRAIDAVGAPRFLVLDMLAIDGLGEFDAILCLGNTLVHLETTGVFEDFLRKVHRQMKPGGVFIVQALNYDRILADRSVTFDTLETPNLVFRRAYGDITDEAITFRIELENKATGETISDETSLLPLKRDTVVEIMGSVGLVLENEFRGFDGTPAGERDFARVSVFRKDKKRVEQ